MEELLNTTEVKWVDRVFTNSSLGTRLLNRLDWTNLRHCFYLISPYETAVGTLDEVPNYNVQVSVWWVTLIFIEFTVLMLQHHDDRFALNDTITSFCAGMLSQCFKFGGRTVAIFLYVFIWNNFRILELPWDSPWTWIFCLIFQDFLYYLGHRAVHEAGFFWGLHTIHHSSEYYNLSTALRQAAIQDAGLAIYDVFQAFCIPPPIFLVHRYFSEIFQFVMHTSLLDTCGPLGLVFNTPSHHRVHHGRNPYCIDKNYGGVFIIWDRMFNTFAAERPDDPPIYGLVHNEHNFNQIYLQFHTLYEMLCVKWRRKDEKGEPIFKTWLQKLQATYYPPGWLPGVPVFRFFHWFSLEEPAYGVPEVEYPVVKYNPPIEVWKKVYCVVHFVFLLCIFMHFEYDRADLGYVDFTLKIAFFVVTMQGFGAVFDKKWYAGYIEMFRGSGVLSFYLYKIFTDGVLPNRLCMMALFSSSILLWMFVEVRKACNDPQKVADVNMETNKPKMEISSISDHPKLCQRQSEKA
ncbi:unnamed protein product [Bursaphelenchus okinawaensis]|uniref:Alkylglycerol monooxygenase n=1 Tax=Bursaphelenchus okinawaensis TaxID=465554 RepID=A0A811KFU3_9BILA|nr:unnamed protein product [Bursaphelenchus okinawaensis]CAG9102431.1 unnamed protein product [Bursaphelenchus okinawaensis]